MVKKISVVFLAILFFSTAAFSACDKNSATGSLSDSLSDESAVSSGGKSSSDSKESSGESASASSGESSSPSGSGKTSSESGAVSSSGKSSSSKSSSAPSSSSKSSSASSSSSAPKKYYIGASWNGYLANDEGSVMTAVSGSTRWYSYTMTLTTAMRKDYSGTEGPGHWYKVTEGDWTNCYGTDNYCVSPAPVEYTSGGTPIGLGSIYIRQADGAAPIVLTILFDSVNKIVYDNADGKTLPAT